MDGTNRTSDPHSAQTKLELSKDEIKPQDATGGRLGFDVHPRVSRDAAGGRLGSDVHPRVSRDAAGGRLGFDVHPRASRDATGGPGGTG